MQIRQGKYSDRDQIVSLFGDLDLIHIENQNDFKSPPNIQRHNELIERCLNHKNYCLSIVELNSKIIGFGIGRLIQIVNHSYLIDKKIGEILYLIIDQEFKNKGYGKSLLEHLEGGLRNIGAERLELKVYDFNKEAFPEKANYHKKSTIYEKLVNNNTN